MDEREEGKLIERDIERDGKGWNMNVTIRWKKENRTRGILRRMKRMEYECYDERKEGSRMRGILRETGKGNKNVTMRGRRERQCEGS